MYPQANRYILDSNGRGDFYGWSGYISSAHAPRPLGRGFRSLGRQQVWAPHSDDLDEYDIWLEGIRRAKVSAIVFIDELSSVVGVGGSSTKYPTNFARLLKQGRVVDLQRNQCICTIIGTQEQAYMPRQVLNQLTHVIRFRLQSVYDARAVDKALGVPTETQQPDTKWGFVHIRADNPMESHLYNSPEQFFGSVARAA